MHDIEVRVKEFEKIRDAADQKLTEIIQYQRALFDQRIEPGENYKKELLNQYSEKAVTIYNNGIEFHNRRADDRVEPDDIIIQVNGLLLWWGADHPNDRYSHLITWEQLDEII